MTIISSNKLHKRDFNVDRMEEIKEVRPEINFTTFEAAKSPSFRVFYFKSAFRWRIFVRKNKKKHVKWSSWTEYLTWVQLWLYTSSVFTLYTVSGSLQVHPSPKSTPTPTPVSQHTTPWSLASRAAPARCGWPAGDWLEQCVCRFHHLLAPAEGYQRSLQWRRCTRSWGPNSSKTDLVFNRHFGSCRLLTWNIRKWNTKRKTMSETWMVEEVDYVTKWLSHNKDTVALQAINWQPLIASKQQSSVPFTEEAPSIHPNLQKELDGK